MKNWIFLPLLIFAACRKAAPSPTVHDAYMYLQPMVHLGESQSNLISKFGPPFNEYTTSLGQVSATFFFSDTNLSAEAHGVGGITLFFKEDRLVGWDPVYSQRGPKL